eukprot:g37603.t1
MQVDGYCGWSVGSVEWIVEEAKDGHVAKGVEAGVKVDGNQKVGLVGACRAQLLHELVPESAFGLPVIEETTSRATDTLDEEAGKRSTFGFLNEQKMIRKAN